MKVWHVFIIATILVIVGGYFEHMGIFLSGLMLTAGLIGWIIRDDTDKPGYKIGDKDGGTTGKDIGKPEE